MALPEVQVNSIGGNKLVHWVATHSPEHSMPEEWMRRFCTEYLFAQITHILEDKMWLLKFAVGGVPYLTDCISSAFMQGYQLGKLAGNPESVQVMERIYTLGEM